MPPVPLLHILAHPGWHEPAFVIGNRVALENLRDAITRTLAGSAHPFTAFENDGEGYSVHVVCLPDERMDEVPLGYTDDICRGNIGWPEWLVGLESMS